jgi:YebC/PmpR family DNA-binding regulatory protein
MPNDKIKALLEKNNKDTSSYTESVYEGYGVGGVAVVVKCLTDNKNRTISDVRHAFDKFGGSLGATGSVTYMFENKGVVVLEKTADFDADMAMELALEVEALDCEDDEVFTIYTEPTASEVNRIGGAFSDAGYTVLSSEVEMIPQNYVTLDDHQRETFEKMLAKLDESDDVQEVIHNLEED